MVREIRHEARVVHTQSYSMFLRPNQPQDRFVEASMLEMPSFDLHLAAVCSPLMFPKLFLTFAI